MTSGNLAEVLKKIREKGISFTEADAANLVYQILLALTYLHSSEVNVVHRDLKLENIMVDIEKYGDGSSKLICKITDFGFAVALDPSGKETLALGTPTYMAPEIVSQQAYDKGVDIWALGVTVYIMLTGMPPFRSKTGSKQDMYDAIVNQPLNLKPLDRYYQNGTLIKNFIKKCLNRNPSARHSASVLMNDPWIKAMVEEDRVEHKEQVCVGINMAYFRDATLFQSSVITFLVRLKSDKEDMSKLRRVFTKVDLNHDGFLSQEEIE